MMGRMSQDIITVGRGSPSDFGAGRLYNPNMTRAGEIVAPNRKNEPTPSVLNTRKQGVMQVITVLPAPKRSPLSAIKSNYTFLPTGNVNGTGR